MGLFQKSTGLFSLQPYCKQLSSVNKIIKLSSHSDKPIWYYILTVADKPNTFVRHMSLLARPLLGPCAFHLSGVAW